MKNKKRHGWKKAAVTAGMGVFVAALTVPLVRVPAYAAYQPDYSYPPSGKGGVHVSDETAPGTDATAAFGNVTGNNMARTFMWLSGMWIPMIRRQPVRDGFVW